MTYLVVRNSRISWKLSHFNGWPTRWWEIERFLKNVLIIMDDLRGCEKFIYFLKMVSCNEKPTRLWEIQGFLEMAYPIVRNLDMSWKLSHCNGRPARWWEIQGFLENNFIVMDDLLDGDKFKDFLKIISL
jgi:hypothetical protein